MKKRISFFGILGIFLSLVMIFFTFFAFGWFSDMRGLEGYFEIPVSTQNGFLSTFADCIWVISPFFVFLSFFLCLLFDSQKIRSLSVFLSSVPLSCYALLQIILFMGEKEGHFALLITFFFLITAGALGCYSVFVPELTRFSGQLYLIHAFVEILLVVLSVLFGEKYSQFYFSQILPMGKHSGFRFSFFLISVFLYYLSYSLSLAVLHVSRNKKITQKEREEEPTEKILAQKEAGSPLEEEDSSEENETSLTLEDFGIQR